MIKMSGFSYEQQQSLFNTALRKDPEDFLRIYKTLLRQDRDFTAKRLESNIGKSNER